MLSIHRFCAILLLLPWSCAPADRSIGKWDPACLEPRFENMHPQCTERERSVLNARFSLPSIELFHRHGRAGDDAIIINRWYKAGGGMALIFHRDRTGQPLTEVRARPHRSVQSKMIKRRAGISQAAWNDVLAKGQSLNLTYSNDRICTAGVTLMIEVMDNAGRVRTLRGNPCGGGPGNHFASSLADMALAALPACAAWKSGDHGPPFEILEACLAR